MPAYTFDFTSDAGAERVQFTLDDDRPLTPQLFQVHEELRQRGLVIRGGPNDEIAAFWNGVEVDQSQTAQQLGLSPRLPIELRLRPAPSKAPRRAPELPPQHFIAKGWAVAALAGFFGALVAWTLAAGFVDLGDVVDSYAELDGVVAMLLGAGIGAAALAADAWKESRNVALGGLVGAVVGVLGAVLGAAAGGALGGSLSATSTALAFVGVRVGAWSLLAGALGVAISLPAGRRDSRRLLDGLLFGLVGGALAGLVYCFPGPADAWQLLAFVLVGTTVAAGASGPSLQRSAAILELESLDRRAVGVLTLREWGLDERTGASLGHDRETARVEWTGGRFAVRPGDGSTNVVVSGHPIATAIYLRNHDVIDLGSARYRFRRLRETPA